MAPANPHSTNTQPKATPKQPAAMPPKNKMGLTVLYDPAKPPDPKTKRRIPNVDLVLVHGLNGGYLKTWACTTDDPNAPVVWPQTLLPEAQPHTRVLSLGYSGDIYENPSITGIRDNARSLLANLKLRRSSDPARPVVFLGHCLGGLIVKQALCFADNEDEYSSIASATRSVMFFGTPHFGADERKWLSIANAFTPMAETKTAESPGRPSRLVEMITRSSRDLAEIGEDFCQIAPRYAIKTFYETLPWKGTRKTIVDKMDAHMFVDNEVPVLVHADHAGMVQFEDDDDATFLLVCQTISEAATVKSKKETPAPAPPPPQPPQPQPLEEWMARDRRERVAREIAMMVRALDGGRAAHTGPSPARRAAIDTAREYQPSAPLLLDAPPAQQKMPWEEHEKEEEREKVAVPVFSRAPARVRELEEDEDDDEESEAEMAPVNRHAMSWSGKKEERAAVPLPHEDEKQEKATGSDWDTGACVSDSEIEDGDDSDEEKAPPVVVPVPPAHQETRTYSIGNGKRASAPVVTTTAGAVEVTEGSDEEIEKGPPVKEHSRRSNFLSRVASKLGAGRSLIRVP